MTSHETATLLRIDAGARSPVATKAMAERLRAGGLAYSHFGVWRLTTHGRAVLGQVRAAAGRMDAAVHRAMEQRA